MRVKIKMIFLAILVMIASSFMFSKPNDDILFFPAFYVQPKAKPSYVATIEESGKKLYLYTVKTNGSGNCSYYRAELKQNEIQKKDNKRFIPRSIAKNKSFVVGVPWYIVERFQKLMKKK